MVFYFKTVTRVLESSSASSADASASTGASASAASGAKKATASKPTSSSTSAGGASAAAKKKGTGSLTSMVKDISIDDHGDDSNARKVEMLIYMGADKMENESLLKYGWEEDIWFHVDDLSSAHVYLRVVDPIARKIFLETGNLDHVPDALKDCLSLVKANSIEGCKKSTVDVVYTPFSNLRKTAMMADGQVGFVDNKRVIKVREVEKNKDMVKRLEKTMEEKFPDLEEEKKKHEQELIAQKKDEAKKMRQLEKEKQQQYQAEKEAKSYDKLMDPDAMLSNKELQSSKDTSAAVKFEDDFM